MHFENRFYGHRLILALYAGLTKLDAPILGFLQHGWDAHSQFRGGDPTWPGSRLLVWNSRDLATAKESGATRVVAIGSPFLYLLKTLESEAQGSTVTAAQIHVSFPGHARTHLIAAKAHERYAQHLLSSRSSREIVVCLFWKDFEDAAVRGAYESRGLSTTTIGHRDDPMVLFRQYLLLQRAASATSNVISTALLNAGALGLPVSVSGPPFDMDSPRDAQIRREDEAARWPELYRPSPTTLTQPLAEGELGREFLLPPGELAAVLGWTRWSQRAWARASAPGLGAIVSAAHKRRGRQASGKARHG